MRNGSNHGNTSLDHKRARALRNNPSPFEQRVWVVLREQAKVKDIKFRRQQPIHPYIVDFACMAARLIVELDGDSHDTRLGYDKTRDSFLRDKGFTVLRFTNQDVAQSLEHVIGVIIAAAEKLISTKNSFASRQSPLPNPPHQGEGITPLLLQGDSLHPAQRMDI